jgi:hypothetical protein
MWFTTDPPGSWTLVASAKRGLGHATTEKTIADVKQTINALRRSTARVVAIVRSPMFWEDTPARRAGDYDGLDRQNEDFLLGNFDATEDGAIDFRT